jgi:hypothetical protein
MKIKCPLGSREIGGTLTIVILIVCGGGLTAAPLIPGATKTSPDEHFISNAFGDTDEHQKKDLRGTKMTNRMLPLKFYRK